MSWNRFDTGVRNLAKNIEKSGIKFKSIYGIPRGGLIIAIRLSHLLDIPFTEFPEESTLICDDVVDTGKTLCEDDESGFKTASLYWNPEASFKPNFYIYDKPKNSWIVFPWESK
jgi:hypoxanthine phosphoribosyltransferase